MSKNLDHNIEESKISTAEVFDLALTLKIIWKKKLTLASFVGIFSIASLIYALSLPDIYRSKAILAPAESADSLNRSISSMSGLASIAGISLPNSDSDKLDMGLEVLKSLSFFEEFIKKENITAPLVAGVGWDKSTGSLIYDEDKYDPSTDTWLDSEPSLQESHGKLMQNMSIFRSPKTGFVEISLDHFSPFYAEKWLRLLIHEINEKVRSEDMTVTELSIEFLEKEISSTQLLEVRNGLNMLMQDQIQKRMVAKATPEYLFKVLAKPFAPEKKNSPRRSIICILGFLTGFILGVLYIFLITKFKQSVEQP